MTRQDNDSITLFCKVEFMEAYQVLIINLVRVTCSLFIQTTEACKLFSCSCRSLRRPRVMAVWGMWRCRPVRQESQPTAFALHNATFLTLKILKHHCLVQQGSLTDSASQIFDATRLASVFLKQNLTIQISVPRM